MYDMERKIKITDKCPRKVLNEGRNYQMGFAFVKETGVDQYDTVQPISPCKDYLNDVLISEKLGVPVEEFGLKYSKKGIFEGGHANLVFKICGQTATMEEKYVGMDEDEINLENRIPSIIKLMNFVETQLKITDKTIIEKTDTKGLYLATFSLEWIRSTYMISLYSLLIRLAQYWDESQIALDTFLEEGDWKTEKSLWTSAKPKYKAIAETGHPIQYFQLYKERPGNIHGVGILNLR